MTENKMPDISKVQLTKDVLDKAVARTLLNEGWHLGLITDAESAVGKEKPNLMTVLSLAALTDHKDANSTTSPVMKYYITTPFKNPEVADHEPPDTGSLMVQNMQAIFGTDEDDGGFALFPRKNKDTGNYEFKGQAIDVSEFDGIKADITERVLLKVLEGLQNPKMYVNNYAVYFKVEHKEYNGQLSANVTRIANELPTGVTCVPKAEMKIKV